MQFSLCSFHCAVLIAVDAGNQSARTLYPVPEQSIREHAILDDDTDTDTPSEPYDDVVEEWDKLVDWLNGIVEKH